MKICLAEKCNKITSKAEKQLDIDTSYNSFFYMSEKNITNTSFFCLKKSLFYILIHKYFSVEKITI